MCRGDDRMQIHSAQLIFSLLATWVSRMPFPNVEFLVAHFERHFCRSHIFAVLVKWKEPIGFLRTIRKTELYDI
jgi:hypothetical protein